jgi:hypothetical protein
VGLTIYLPVIFLINLKTIFIPISANPIAANGENPPEIGLPLASIGRDLESK